MKVEVEEEEEETDVYQSALTSFFTAMTASSDRPTVGYRPLSALGETISRTKRRSKQLTKKQDLLANLQD